MRGWQVKLYDPSLTCAISAYFKRSFLITALYKCPVYFTSLYFISNSCYVINKWNWNDDIFRNSSIKVLSISAISHSKYNQDNKQNNIKEKSNLHLKSWYNNSIHTTCLPTLVSKQIKTHVLCKLSSKLVL